MDDEYRWFSARRPVAHQRIYLPFPRLSSDEMDGSGEKFRGFETTHERSRLSHNFYFGLLFYCCGKCAFGVEHTDEQLPILPLRFVASAQLRSREHLADVLELFRVRVLF